MNEELTDDQIRLGLTVGTMCIYHFIFWMIAAIGYALGSGGANVLFWFPLIGAALGLFIAKLLFAYRNR